MLNWLHNPADASDVTLRTKKSLKWVCQYDGCTLKIGEQGVNGRRIFERRVANQHQSQAGYCIRSATKAAKIGMLAVAFPWTR